MTLSLIVLRPDRALLATDSVTHDAQGRVRRGPDGSLLDDVEKLFRFPKANAVALVRGRTEVIGFLRKVANWSDVDMAIEGVGKALSVARYGARLSPPDYSKHEAHRRTSVHVVGHSMKLGRIVCARFLTKDQGTTFETQLVPSDEKGRTTAIQFPPLANWTTRPLNTPQDLLEFARAQIRESPDTGSPFCFYGGWLRCAEVTQDSVLLSTPGDLGDPQRAG